MSEKTNNSGKLNREKSATLMAAAASAGFIAVGPIPLEMERRGRNTTNTPAPPVPSPVTQRKDHGMIFIIALSFLKEISELLSYKVPTMH